MGTLHRLTTLEHLGHGRAAGPARTTPIGQSCRSNKRQPLCPGGVDLSLPPCREHVKSFLVCRESCTAVRLLQTRLPPSCSLLIDPPDLHGHRPVPQSLSPPDLTEPTLERISDLENRPGGRGVMLTLFALLPRGRGAFLHAACFCLLR
jgi:hypothetical protein